MATQKETLLKRLRDAARSGWQAAAAKFYASQESLLPINADLWDSAAARFMRYQHLQSYYFNTIYNEQLNPNAQYHKKLMGLYRFTRAVYNPVPRVVETYTSTIYGGNIDFEKGTRGAIPLIADQRVIDSALHLWKTSKWQSGKSLYVRNGAMLGDTVVKVVDDPIEGKVWLEVLPPSWIRDIEFDALGNVTRVLIAYKQMDYNTGEEFVYGEEITRDYFRTLRDGEKHGFYANPTGEVVAEWENEYGFVPLQMVKHLDVGAKFGAAPYFNSLGKIDEQNSLASKLNDQINKVVQPIFYLAGVQNMSQLTQIEAEQGDILYVFGPANSQATPMVYDLDIAATQSVINATQKEILSDLPELAVTQLRESSTPPSGVALNVIYRDASRRFEEAGGNYDAGTVRVTQMGIAIGAKRGYEGYEGMSSVPEENEMQIAERPLFPDNLTKQQRIEYLIRLNGRQDALVFDEMDIDEALLESLEPPEPEPVEVVVPDTPFEAPAEGIVDEELMNS